MILPSRHRRTLSGLEPGGADGPGWNAGDDGVGRDILGHHGACAHDRAVARCHVTGLVEGTLGHFKVATFITAANGLVTEVTEVWTDVAQTAPEGTRPG